MAAIAAASSSFRPPRRAWKLARLPSEETGRSSSSSIVLVEGSVSVSVSFYTSKCVHFYIALSIKKGIL
jgi:hypothetical protein